MDDSSRLLIFGDARPNAGLKGATMSKMFQHNVFVPRIDNDQYENLRNVLGSNAPPSYKDWQNIFLQREISSLGKPSIFGYTLVNYVHIDPEEFSRFCSSTGTERNIDGIDEFMSNKFSGKNF
ncbi:hypothetical protein [Telmatospirillum sp.]|uniref:hypothetical protein n=1 Tax=Telmatospirillum sp. TaxID=2079197 RepID=UPI0028445679|nr:hypothetical protein [Telmatospirillum sp.]MDR3437726.1 hypothetical protein [Telmatospirillum sp.]